MKKLELGCQNDLIRLCYDNERKLTFSCRNTYELEAIIETENYIITYTLKYEYYKHKAYIGDTFTRRKYIEAKCKENNWHQYCVSDRELVKRCTIELNNKLQSMSRQK